MQSASVSIYEQTYKGFSVETLRKVFDEMTEKAHYTKEVRKTFQETGTPLWKAPFDILVSEEALNVCLAAIEFMLADQPTVMQTGHGNHLVCCHGYQAW